MPRNCRSRIRLHSKVEENKIEVNGEQVLLPEMCISVRAPYGEYLTFQRFEHDKRQLDPGVDKFFRT
jgi:hypothetical protein